jgi:DNA-binding Lrp family transcriptional regulator
MTDASAVSPPAALLPATREPLRTRAADSTAGAELSQLDKRLLDDFQRDFPVCARPYAAMGKRLGCDEATVLERLEWLQQRGYVSRIGPVFRPNRLGASTLAAMAVPAERLQEVAKLVSSYSEVNHNYEREHAFNLWFVVTARDQAAVNQVLAQVRRRTGLAVMDLPLSDEFHIDLGFSLWQT